VTKVVAVLGDLVGGKGLGGGVLVGGVKECVSVFEWGEGKSGVRVRNQITNH